MFFSVSDSRGLDLCGMGSSSLTECRLRDVTPLEVSEEGVRAAVGRAGTRTLFSVSRRKSASRKLEAGLQNFYSDGVNLSVAKVVDVAFQSQKNTSPALCAKCSLRGVL